MKKGFQNPFALNPAQKFGLYPNPGVLQELSRVRMQHSNVRAGKPNNAEVAHTGSGMSANGRTQPGSALAGNPAHGAAASDRGMQTSQETAQMTSEKGYRTRHGNAQSKTVSQYTGNMELLASEDDLLRGFIMSEVLGRPKCFRRGGGRF